MAGGGANHSQKPVDALMTCPECTKGNCTNCVDRLLLLARKESICECKKSGHEDAMQGEARLKQIQDPVTGDVYGPDAVVTYDGDVRPLG